MRKYSSTPPLLPLQHIPPHMEGIRFSQGTASIKAISLLHRDSRLLGKAEAAWEPSLWEAQQAAVGRAGMQEQPQPPEMDSFIF